MALDLQHSLKLSYELSRPHWTFSAFELLDYVEEQLKVALRDAVDLCACVDLALRERDSQKGNQIGELGD